MIERVPENSAILRKVPDKAARQKARRKILKKMESLGLLRNQEVRVLRNDLIEKKVVKKQIKGLIKLPVGLRYAFDRCFDHVTH